MIYTSGDYGVTWMQDDANSLTTCWAMIVSSAHAVSLPVARTRSRAAAQSFTPSDLHGGYLVLDISQAGTWGAATASSVNGSRLVASDENLDLGNILISLDCGVPWTPRTTNLTFRAPPLPQVVGVQDMVTGNGVIFTSNER